MLAIGYLVAQQMRKASEPMVIEDVESDESDKQYRECVITALKKIGENGRKVVNCSWEISK